MSADPGTTGSTRTIVETALLAGTGIVTNAVASALVTEPAPAPDLDPAAGTDAGTADGGRTSGRPSTAPTSTGASSATGASAAGTRPGRGWGARVWGAGWPKLTAVGLFVAAWQLVAWSGWRPAYVLPGPQPVAAQLAQLAGTGTFWSALATTGLRAVTGFAIAVGVGTLLGLAVSRFRVLRAAVGSLLTGLQTMPSITWFPLAILLFQLSEQAIAFVVVLGAAPSIANGIISGIDHVPPAFTRLGTVLGAHGHRLYRFVIVPAALPAYVAGLNQGWAFAWRSLMAGELLVIIASRPSLGARLAFAQEFGDSTSLIAYMLVILATGMLADAVFSAASRRLRTRRGLAAR